MEDRNNRKRSLLHQLWTRAAHADDATTKEKACCRWVVHVTFVSMSVSVSAARTLAYFSSHSQTQTIGQLDPCISFSSAPKTGRTDLHCLHYSVSISYRNVGVMCPSFFADFKVTRCTSDKVQTRCLNVIKSQPKGIYYFIWQNRLSCSFFSGKALHCTQVLSVLRKSHPKGIYYFIQYDKTVWFARFFSGKALNSTQVLSGSSTGGSFFRTTLPHSHHSFKIRLNNSTGVNRTKETVNVRSRHFK